MSASEKLCFAFYVLHMRILQCHKQSRSKTNKVITFYTALKYNEEPRLSFVIFWNIMSLKIAYLVQYCINSSFNIRVLSNYFNVKAIAWIFSQKICKDDVILFLHWQRLLSISKNISFLSWKSNYRVRVFPFILFCLWLTF